MTGVQTCALPIYEYYSSGGNNIFETGAITVYEGFYVTDTYTYSINNSPRLLISNRNVDISSIGVTVIEDGGSNTITYNRTQSLFDIDGSSPIFFVQGAENSGYELVFGDGVSGRRPKDNAIVIIEYRISNGELSNGCNDFTAESGIEGQTGITVTTLSPASGGSIYESIESIKYNAPRHFAAQERAITTEDYETLLITNFPEINAVTAYGGENLDPPQFGKVFVAVDLIDVDALPSIKKDQYYRFLKPRSPVSIDPVFVDPEYTYLGVNTTVRYNVNTTRLSQDDIQTIAMSSILQYAQLYLNNFNRVFRYSKLVQAIDTSQQSIISNETNVSIIKIITPKLSTYNTFDVAFNIPMSITNVGLAATPCITSSEFFYNGSRCQLSDDGNGRLIVRSVATDTTLDTVGTVDYTTGLLQFSNFKITSYDGNGIKIRAVPLNKDISTINNVILNIIEDDISITVQPIRA